MSIGVSLGGGTGGQMQTKDGYLNQQARLLTAEANLRQNSEFAHAVAKDIEGRLKRLAMTLPDRPEVYFKDRNSEQEYDVRYHVGIARTFRSVLFRSFRYKLLQVHLHGNFKSVIARITAPEGHAFEQGLTLSSREQATEVFSQDYLAEILKSQVVAANEAYVAWKAENSAMSLLRSRF